MNPRAYQAGVYGCASYCCRQREAITVRCIRCARWWRMTIAQLRCVECERGTR
jgi:hypothetical protein